MNIFDYLFSTSKNYVDKKFVLGTKEEITYGQLYQNSLHLAGWINKNIGRDRRILLLAPNSVFFITAYLGIMKSGNVCVPVNIDTEPDNLEYICDVASVSYSFITQNLKVNRVKSELNIIDETGLGKILSENTELSINNWDEFDNNRMAQILFTSGSTGHPKGVMLSHRNLIANTGSIVEYLELGQDDIIEIVLPFHYCYGLSLLHTHLRVGGSIVINNNFIFIGSVLNDLINYKCTGFSGVPSHFQILLRKSESFKKSRFPDLKYVTQAGGKLHNVFIREFVDSFPDIKFFVMYGQTEATARLSYLPSEKVLEKLGSIGKGIPGVTLDIFNEENKPVEVDEIGEVVAKGDNIMLGYLNDPEANTNTLKDGWLHTGDIGKKDADGYIYLLARKKEIIKVRGKRISPKEVEAIIVSLPFVLSCRITGAFDEISGESIKAIIVLQDHIDEDQAKRDIVIHCRKKLALHKIPTSFKFENQISDPLKNSKKI
jgi:acyl-CoA synthetase (AMP-forming)/AMP-acid ligase II